MFQWYRGATVCYVYLVDVPSRVDRSELHDSIARSRWFTRGWTLQELLAPANIIFYSREWKSLGSKVELLEVLSLITGIEEDFLLAKDLGYASISKRMSWAAKRNTSRVEDIAYCLFGIFDVNMPLIYGEGKKAFQRLQHELIKTYPYDHTLYAWGVVVDKSSLVLTKAELPSWNRSDAQRRLLGPLAVNPHAFEFSGSFLLSPHVQDFYNDRRVGRVGLPIPLGLGVEFELPSFSYNSAYHWNQVETTQCRALRIAILFCLLTNGSNMHIAIPIQAWGNMSWGRTLELISVEFKHNPLIFARQVMRMHVEAEQPTLLENGDIIIRRLDISSDLMWTRTTLLEHACWNFGERVVSKTSCGQLVSFYFQPKETSDSDIRGFGVNFGRVPDGARLLGKLSIWIALVRDSAAHDDSVVNYNGAITVTEDVLRRDWSGTELITGIKESNCYRVMEPLADSWILDVEPLPRISIRAERLPVELGREAGVVDVVEMFITKRVESLALPLRKNKKNNEKGRRVGTW